MKALKAQSSHRAKSTKAPSIDGDCTLRSVRLKSDKHKALDTGGCLAGNSNAALAPPTSPGGAPPSGYRGLPLMTEPVADDFQCKDCGFLCGLKNTSPDPIDSRYRCRWGYKNGAGSGCWVCTRVYYVKYNVQFKTIAKIQRAMATDKAVPSFFQVRISLVSPIAGPSFGFHFENVIFSEGCRFNDVPHLLCRTKPNKSWRDPLQTA